MSDLADFYRRGYALDDPAEGERLGRWRALGAAVKADHVVRLLGDRKVDTLVEIGCGDGALLEALGRRRAATVLDGFELSDTAAAMAATRAIPGGRRIEPFDGAHVPAEDGQYDLAVVSHVLEHVPDPAALLAESSRVAKRVVIEVPLEDNRSGRRPAKRAESERIGHIQVFARADMHALFARLGLRVVSELSDPLPRAHHLFFAAGGRQRAVRTAVYLVRKAVWTVAPRRAEQLFTVHYAALLESSA